MKTEFKNGDIIVAQCGTFIFEEPKRKFFKVHCGLYNNGTLRDYDALILYNRDERLATPEEKKRFLDTFRKNEYRWYSRKKKLRNSTLRHAQSCTLCFINFLIPRATTF